MRGRAVWVALALAACCSLFQLLTLRDGHSWMDDAFMYVMHAENLAAGRPYAQTCYAYDPANPYPGPAAYPPGYPAVLAVLIKAGGGFRAFKAANVLFLACLSTCLLLLLRFTPGDPRPLLLAALFGLNPVLWDYKDLVYSDLLFCALLYLALLVWGRAREKGRGAWYAAAGFCCYLAYAVRPLGGLLPAALLLEYAFSRGGWRRQPALAAAAFILPAAVQAVFFDPLGYSGQIASAATDPLFIGAARVLGGFLTSMLNFWVLDPRGAPGAAVVSGALALACLAGFSAGLLRRLRDGKPEAMDFFLPLYVAAVAAARSYDGVRYIFPLMPYLAWKSFEGFGALGEAGGRRAAGAFTALALGLYVWSFSARAEFGSVPGGPYSAEASAMFDYVRGAAGPDGTVVFYKPRSMCFFTGKRSSVYPAYGTDADFLGHFRRTGVSYIVAGRGFGQDARALFGFIERNKGSLAKVYENREFKVFRFSGGRR